MKKSFEITDSFARIDMGLLACERFHALSRTAQVVLIDFIARYRKVENARILFPFRSRLNKGIGRTAFVAAVKELVAAGFLDKDHQNGARATYAESKFWRSGVVENRAGNQTGPASEREAKGEPEPCRKPDRTVPENDTDRAGNQTGPCRKPDRYRAGNQTGTVPENDTDRAGKRHSLVDQIRRSPLPPTDDPVVGRDGADPLSPSEGSPESNETQRVCENVVIGPEVADPPSETSPASNETARVRESVVLGDRLAGRRHPAPQRRNGALAVAFLED